MQTFTNSVEATRSKVMRAFTDYHKDPAEGVDVRSTYKGSVMLVNARAFLFTAIVRAVHAHPARAWLLHAYSFTNNWENEATATRDLFSAFIADHSANLRANTLKNVGRLCHPAIQQYTREVRSLTPLYHPRTLRHLLGLSEKQWQQNYLRHWRTLLDLQRQLDTRALNQLATTLAGATVTTRKREQCLLPL